MISRRQLIHHGVLNALLLGLLLGLAIALCIWRNS